MTNQAAIGHTSQVTPQRVNMSGKHLGFWRYIYFSGCDFSHIGFVQDCNNSSALAMELLQSCTKQQLQFTIIIITFAFVIAKHYDKIQHMECNMYMPITIFITMHYSYHTFSTILYEIHMMQMCMNKFTVILCVWNSRTKSISISGQAACLTCPPVWSWIFFIQSMTNGITKHEAIWLEHANAMHAWNTC